MIPARLLPQKVTVQAYKGSGPYGDVYADPVVVPARVQRTRVLVRNDDGEQVVAEATVFLQPGTTCPPGSKITLPGDTGTRKTIGLAEFVGAHDVHHLEITTQ